MIPLLAPGAPFPALSHALREPYNGLLAASEHLDVDRLLTAYRQGVFPWYAEGEPVLWWSPDPRMVLHTREFVVSRSLRKRLRAVLDDPAISVRIDSSFAQVMRACAEPRPDQQGTWITDEVVDAYGELHRRGLAHSVEVWQSGALVGGLYGVALGRMFYGESMFARVSDASKIALATLVQILLEGHVTVIDCQQKTRHLASLGAREVPRRVFCAHLVEAIEEPGPDWAGCRGEAARDGLARFVAGLRDGSAPAPARPSAS
jgi:leucyl/phenylalanyl-tRNA--protein transferase